MKRIALALIALHAFSASALAQWQTPQYSIPIGRGAGVTGFNSAVPGTDGLPLASNGASANPTFRTIPFSSITGALTCAQVPALTGDVTSPGASCATTLATTQSAAHTWTGINTYIGNLATSIIIEHSATSPNALTFGAQSGTTGANITFTPDAANVGAPLTIKNAGNGPLDLFGGGNSVYNPRIRLADTGGYVGILIPGGANVPGIGLTGTGSVASNAQFTVDLVNTLAGPNAASNSMAVTLRMYCAKAGDCGSEIYGGGSNAAGTFASPATSINGDGMGKWSFFAFNPSGWNGNEGVRGDGRACETQSLTAQGGTFWIDTTQLGTIIEVNRAGWDCLGNDFHGVWAKNGSNVSTTQGASFYKNAVVEPTTTPAGSGAFYVSSQAPRWVNGSGPTWLITQDTGAGAVTANDLSAWTGNGAQRDVPLQYTVLTAASARSVLGVTGNASAAVASIQGTASQFFGINAAGTALAFQTMAGDATLSGPTLTLASVISAAGPIGSATVAPIITYDAKGRLTTVTSATITPAVGSITGLGTGVAPALAINTGTAGSFITNGGALGSPSSAGTIPAFTLGGTVAGGGNQINNVIIGTSTPLAGTFTTATANAFVPNSTSVPTLGIYGSSDLMFSTSSTFRYRITGATLTNQATSPAYTAGIYFIYDGSAAQGIGIKNTTNSASGYALRIEDSTGTNVMSFRVSNGAVDTYITGLSVSAQANALCYNAGNGQITENAGLTTCLASMLSSKDLIAPIDPEDALQIVLAMSPYSYYQKNNHASGVQVGLIADYVTNVDDRLVARDSKGKLSGVRYEQYAGAMLTGAIQALKADINNIHQKLLWRER